MYPCREAMFADLAVIVGDFEAYLVNQKKTSDQMSKFTDNSFREVSEKVSTQTQVQLCTVNCRWRSSLAWVER